MLEVFYYSRDYRQLDAMHEAASRTDYIRIVDRWFPERTRFEARRVYTVAKDYLVIYPNEFSLHQRLVPGATVPQTVATYVCYHRVSD